MQDSLRPLLHEWQVKPPADLEFEAAVWRRIAERKRRLSYRIWHRLEEIAGHPRGAALTVALVMLVGLATGNVWRRHRAHDARVAGITAYVLAVNPVAHAAVLRR